MNKVTNKKLAKDFADQKAYILSHITTIDILETLNGYYRFCELWYKNLNYAKHLQWAYAKAIDLASSIDDIHLVLTELMEHKESEPEIETAINKALILCKNKNDVQCILDYICNDWYVGLSDEKYFVKIFARAHDFDEK